MRRAVLLMICAAFAATTMGAESCGSATAGGGGSSTAGDAPATAAKKKHRGPRTIAKESAHGDYAIAQAGGSVSHPRRIQVVVTARPAQRVSVSWTMVCAQSGGAGSKDGQFKASTPVRRALRKPSRRATDCTVAANAQMDEGGRVTVKLIDRP